MRNIIYRQNLGKETWSMCSASTGQEINHLKYFSSSSPPSSLLLLLLLTTAYPFSPHRGTDKKYCYVYTAPSFYS